MLVDRKTGARTQNQRDAVDYLEYLARVCADTRRRKREEKEGRMRKIVVTEWVSLDGFTAGANGEMDWITAGEDNGDYQNEVVTQADTLLLGRTTYESFAGAWPQRARDPN